MKKTLSLAVIVLTALIATCFAFADSGTKAKVTWITDGDTIKVKQDGQTKTIRVIGIDCPESKPNDKCRRDEKYGRKGCRWQVPHGKKATNRAITLLRGKTVTLECGEKCRSDDYGRKLRYIRLQDGRDYGLELVAEGLCEDFSQVFPHPRQRGYREAQKAAQKAKKGLWK